MSDGGGRGNGVRSPSGLPGMAADPGGGGGWTRMMGLPMSQQKSISGLSNCSCLEMEMNNLGDISVEDFVSLNEDAGAPEWLRGSVGGLLGNGSEADGSPAPGSSDAAGHTSKLGAELAQQQQQQATAAQEALDTKTSRAGSMRASKEDGGRVGASRPFNEGSSLYVQRTPASSAVSPPAQSSANDKASTADGGGGGGGGDRADDHADGRSASRASEVAAGEERGTSSAYGHMSSSGVRRVTTDGEESVTSSMMSASAASATSTHLAGFVDRRCTRDSLEGSSAMSDGRSSGVPRNATSSSDVVSSDGGGSRVGEALAIGPSAGASRSSSPIAGIAGSSGSDPSPNDPSPPEAASAATATPRGSGSSPVRSAANSLPAPMPSHALALSDGGAADQIANGEAEPAASADAPIAQSLKRRRNSGSSDASAVAGSGGSGGVSPNSKSPRQTRAKLR